ncbi:MAG: SDR family oxidoreductase [Candidatus Omnitrophota bacterium]
MKVIVTGGAGFIGSHLVERLVGDGHQVIILDNLSTGRPDNLKNIKKSEFSLIDIDISGPGSIGHYFKDIDWVFHLAALADIIPSITYPQKYHKANVDGTLAVLEASRTHGVKRLVYAASSSCYGIPDISPTPETAAAAPQYPYALTKFIAEQYCFFWAKVYKLPVLSLRFFNVYGPRSRTAGAYGAVMGVFLAQKLHGLPFTVVGDGEQRRDFIYVSDVVEALIAAAACNINNEVFNVGTGNPQSINTLVSLLGGEKIHIPRRPGEPDCTRADISKIRSMLGWAPKVSFEEGIGLMLKNIEYWKDAPVWTPEKIEEATGDWFRCLSAEG